VLKVGEFSLLFYGEIVLMCGKLLYYVENEEEDQELSQGETNEKQEDNEKDEEEANKEMNFDDKEGLPKVVRIIIPKQSQHGTVHDETS
jgi:hypothetical protein